MASMVSARAALAARVANVTGVRVASDGTAPGQVTPESGKPAAVVVPDPGVFMRRDSQGSYVFSLRVLLLVATQLMDAAQRALDGYIDDVFTALEDDSAGDGLTVFSVTASSYGGVTYAGETYQVGCQFDVEAGVI